jgi:hypothetical protein
MKSLPTKRPLPFAALAGIALGLLALAVCPANTEEVRPFETGETLTYKLRWKFFNAGTAVFQVQPIKEWNGEPARHFVLTIRSSAFLDVFYKIRDRVEAFTDPDVTRSLLYKNQQREGSYSRDVVVTFDWEANTAQFENRGEKLDPIPVLPGTLDPLSIIYHLRMQELALGKELEAPATDGKRLVTGKVRIVEKRKKLKVPAGKFEAFLVEPVLEGLGGVVKRSKAGGVEIWITADARRIPLKVSGKAQLGSFSAVLVSVDSEPM